MKFNVTQRDIANGIPRDACSCPIAMAVKRKFPKASIITVFEKIFVYSGRYEARLFSATLPPDVFIRLKEFDNGPGMTPFSFEVENEW